MKHRKWSGRLTSSGIDDQCMTLRCRSQISGGEGALPLGCHRVPTSPQQGDDLSVVFHTCGGFGCSPFMHIFRAGHFHICARRGIYETVTDSWALPPTSTAQFLAGLGKWTRKEEPKKGQKIVFVPRHRLYSVKRQKLDCFKRTQDVVCQKTEATLP